MTLMICASAPESVVMLFFKCKYTANGKCAHESRRPVPNRARCAIQKRRPANPKALEWPGAAHEAPELGGRVRGAQEVAVRRDLVAGDSIQITHIHEAARALPRGLGCVRAPLSFARDSPHLLPDWTGGQSRRRRDSHKVATRAQKPTAAVSTRHAIAVVGHARARGGRGGGSAGRAGAPARIAPAP